MFSLQRSPRIVLQKRCLEVFFCTRLAGRAPGKLVTKNQLRRPKTAQIRAAGDVIQTGTALSSGSGGCGRKPQGLNSKDPPFSPGGQPRSARLACAAEAPFVFATEQTSEGIDLAIPLFV